MTDDRLQRFVANAQAAQRAVDDILMYGRHYKPGEFLPFYVPRPRMPQVDEVYYPRLVADAITTPGVTFDVMPVTSLHAHQRISKRRADTMPDNIKLKPVLVSADGFIVDGNHRWWAHVHAGDRWISVIRLGLNFEQALDWTLALPYVYEITPTTPERN